MTTTLMATLWGIVLAAGLLCIWSSFWEAPVKRRERSRFVAELADDRACELLRDVRRVARDPRRHRHGADGKPLFRGGCTLADRQRQR